ncbi:MAG: EFR1 family ferrodoxin [Spirochaetota bacterium]
MVIDIYYFTGTGNSLATARRLAGRCGGRLAALAPAAELEQVHTAETLVVVFPSYLAHLHGVPLVVERFLGRVTDLGRKRVYAVCTCGGYEAVNALPTLRSLRRSVRALGGRIHGEFSVRLPMNNLDYEHIPVPIESNTDVIVSRSLKKVDAIAEAVSRGRATPFRFAKRLLTALLSPMYLAMRRPCMESLRKHAHEPPDSPLTFRELIPLTDNDIVVGDACTGCGTCAKVCPIGNVRMESGRPFWNHRCEMCFACDEWCPTGAIHHWGKTPGRDYHHPGVTVADLVQQAQG